MASDDVHETVARRLLDTDALSELEAQTGLDYKDPRVAGAGFIALSEMHEKRRALLSEIGDTYWVMPTGSFEAVLGPTGFEIVSRVEGENPYGKIQVLVAADRTRKLLIIAHSNRGNDGTFHMDTIRLYGTVDNGVLPEEERPVGSRLIELGGSYTPVGETAFAFKLDVPEGLLLKLRQMEEQNLNFTDWLHDGPRVPIYIGNDTEREALSSLPDWVIAFMRYNPADDAKPE